MNLRAEVKGAADFVKRLAIKVASAENPVSSLTGGNQQKALMTEPSRGMDIGAKAEVFCTMRWLAASGRGILFVTSDLEDVTVLSGRITAVISAATPQ